MRKSPAQRTGNEGETATAKHDSVMIVTATHRQCPLLNRLSSRPLKKHKAKFPAKKAVSSAPLIAVFSENSARMASSSGASRLVQAERKKAPSLQVRMIDFSMRKDSFFKMLSCWMPGHLVPWREK